MDNKNEPLAIELYNDLKKANEFKNKCIACLFALVVVLVAALAATNIYHIYQWSQFDTVVVDSQDGGNANYVQGDNTGGIFNGESGSSAAEEGALQGSAN